MDDRIHVFLPISSLVTDVPICAIGEPRSLASPQHGAVYMNDDDDDDDNVCV